MVDFPIIEPHRYFDARESSSENFVFQETSYLDIERIIKADTERKFELLKRKYDLIVPDEEPSRLEPSSIQDFQTTGELLRLAMRLKEIISKKRITRDDLKEAGIGVTLADETTWYELKKRTTEKLKILKLSEKDIPTLAPSMYQIIKIKGQPFIPSYDTIIEGDDYKKFLDTGVEHARSNGFKCGYFELYENWASLEIGSGFYELSSNGMREGCVHILDALFCIHLHDVATLTKEGEPYQRCNSLLSSLWYCLAESFRGGRTTRCKVCDIPLIAFNERGKKRLYCSDACRKWSERNPGEKRKRRGLFNGEIGNDGFDLGKEVKTWQR